MGFGSIFGKSSPEKQKKKEEAKALKQKQKEEKAAAKAKKKEDKKREKMLDNEIVAKVSMNVAMDTKSRSSLTMEELMDCNTGHSWIEVQMLDSVLDPETKAVRPDLAECMGTLAPKIAQEQDGNVSMGFYPETYWEIGDDRREQKLAQHQERAESYFSPGRGYSYDQSKKQKKGTLALLTTPGPGVVEEPDDACGVAKGRKTFDVTRAQFKQIYAYVNAHRHHKYNFVTYNCTTFASHALQAGGLSLSAEFLPGICMPTAFYKSIYKDAKKTDDEGASKGIELQKLGYYYYNDKKGMTHFVFESHGKFNDSKIAGGENVRVKGKDEKDMNRHTYLTHAQKRQIAAEEEAARIKAEAEKEAILLAQAEKKDGKQPAAAKPAAGGYVAARGPELARRQKYLHCAADLFKNMVEGLCNDPDMISSYASQVDGWEDLEADKALKLGVLGDYFRWLVISPFQYGGTEVLNLVKELIAKGIPDHVIPSEAYIGVPKLFS